MAQAFAIEQHEFGLVSAMPRRQERTRHADAVYQRGQQAPEARGMIAGEARDRLNEARAVVRLP